jgi:asparagine synthase (glutamine-hydrolysing)
LEYTSRSSGRANLKSPMCGINGYIGFTSKNEGLSTIHSMNDALKHRGPDNLGIWNNDKVAFGHARLSIIDLSDSANQPFISADGNYTIIFNGEIYNYKDVKTQITSQFPELTFKTNSDTEILLQAYIKLGSKCLDLLNGMFAFAIWDSAKQNLFIARDRIGEKPLYYSHNSTNFLFSSEIRSLLASNKIPKKLNQAALLDYVQYQTVHAPQTLIENVFMLMPGHYLEFVSGKLSTSQYWRPEIKNPETATAPATAAQIKSLFEDSINLRMVADVEVGAFLSGGIDSSAVVAQMAQLSPKPISTFSIIFGEKDFSEEEFSNQIAKQYNTKHHPIRIEAKDFLNEIPSILKAVDFPGGDGPNTYAVAHATRKTGIKVALTGLGGDELFAGYPVFKQAYKFHQKKCLQNMPLVLRKVTGSVAKAIKRGTAGDKLNRILSSKELNNATFYSLSRQLFDKEFAKQLLKDPTNETLPVETIAKAIFNNNIKDHLLSQVSIAEMTTYMQNVLLRDTDQMTMAHALEVRAPFLDHRLIEYALSVNDEIKFPHSPKQLFVKAMGDLLPPEVVNRKKMGFTFPWEHWLRNEMKDYCSTRVNNLSKRIYFNETEILHLWNRFTKFDASVPWTRIWHLVTLEEWLTNNKIE